MANPNTESSSIPKAGPTIAACPKSSGKVETQQSQATKATKGAEQAAATDLDQWQDLASGKTFALMHKGEIVFGREDRDRKAWTAKLMPELAKYKKEGVQRVGAVGQSTSDSESAEADRQGAELMGGAAANPLTELDQCLADLRDNQRKLAEHTEKSIRSLWHQTKEHMATQQAQLKERERTLDQLAMQNRTLKAEAGAKAGARAAKKGS